MSFTWVLILYIHASGTVLNIADYGADKPDCDRMAASFNAGHDTSVQTFVCVTKAKPADVPKLASPKAPAPGVSDEFLRGMALGYTVGAGSKQ